MTLALGEPAETVRQAVRVVLAMLPQDRPPTPTEVEQCCEMVHLMQTSRGAEVDRMLLQREVESSVAVFQEDSTGLENNTGHLEWLAEAKANRPWEFWDRYRRYLEDVKGMPREVVRQLDRTTDRILKRVEDPQRPGAWRRSGLVVGQVQSGKTGNYVGLVCKAADAGYKLVVVLAGTHNSLRSQTQLRVDEGLLGFDTQYQQRSDEEKSDSRIGAGAIPGAPRLKIASLTTSAETGDFKRAVANNTGLPIGDFPVVLVVKKHRGILGYLRRWIVEVEGSPTGGSGQRLVDDVPILVIDDEADHASIDTSRDEDTDPSKVNAAIRELLASFTKAAYVGYTATPFANIYIDHRAEHDVYSADLFPTAFIESLKAPSNYFGPERVFGLAHPDEDEPDVEPLPVLRVIDDESAWMPDRHRRDWRPPSDVPESLRRAVSSFVLTCAARRARGQRAVHNSMLVHVTRFQDVQKLVTEDLIELVELTTAQLRDVHSAAGRETLDGLRKLWESDFEPTMNAFDERQAIRTPWADVEAELRPALERILVRAINGTSKDALTYYDYRHTGLSVIAVGGDKLSRGLTLEGLTVSYYLRASKTFDTLLQMGRWFGYRPGHEDLCRLYTTKPLAAAYAEIVAADHELRRDFDEMAALELSPTEFGLRIRNSRLKLNITAANKMRRSRLVRFSFSGDIPETVAFSLKSEDLAANASNLESFVQRLGTPRPGSERGGSHVWTDVAPDDIVEGFLDGYGAVSRSWRVRPSFIAKYILQAANQGELGRWTIRLVSSTQGASHPVAGLSVGLVKRSPRGGITDALVYSTRRLVSPVDEASDLSEEQRARALTRSKPVRRTNSDGVTKLVPATVPSGAALRHERSPDEALLLIYVLANPLNDEEPGSAPHPPVIGFAISFPESPNAVSVEYRVNEIWTKQELDQYFDQDDS